MKNRISKKNYKKKLISKLSFNNKQSKNTIYLSKDYSNIIRNNIKNAEEKRIEQRKIIREREINKTFAQYQKKLYELNPKFVKDPQGTVNTVEQFKIMMNTYGTSPKETAAKALENARQSGIYLTRDQATDIYERLIKSDRVNEDFGSINNYSTRVYYRPAGAVYGSDDYDAADVTFRNKGREKSIEYIYNMPKNLVMALMLDAGLQKDTALTYIGY